MLSRTNSSVMCYVCLSCDLPLQYYKVFTVWRAVHVFFFFLNDTAPTEIYTLSLHDALPILVEDGVLAARLQELGVGAAFTHAAGFQVEDQVRPAGQQQVVSDQECGPSLGQPLQRLDHRTCVLAVQARGGLVEDKDRGTPDGRTGDRDPLALPVGERHAALPDHGVVSLRQRLDERMGVGEAGGGLDRLVRRAGGAVSDVVPARRGGQPAVLEDDTHPRAQGREP